MPKRPALPESYLSVGMRSLQTPVHGKYKQQSPSLRLPVHLFEGWGVVPRQGKLYTRDHDNVTVISPDLLAGEGVVRRSLQAKGLMTMPSGISIALGGVPNEMSTPVGIIDWGERLAIVASPDEIVRRLGAVSLTVMGAPDREVLGEFAEDILATRLRHDIVLPGTLLNVTPAAILAEMFHELRG